jgi:hypothetical protein
VNIGFFSYLFAAVAFSVLTILLIFTWRGRQLGVVVTLASAFSVIWAVVSAISSLYPSLPVAYRLNSCRPQSWPGLQAGASSC